MPARLSAESSPRSTLRDAASTHNLCIRSLPRLRGFFMDTERAVGSQDPHPNVVSMLYRDFALWLMLALAVAVIGGYPIRLP